MRFIGWMMTRGRTDKVSLPHPPPGLSPTSPVPFTQDPRELKDIIREQRDMDRRRTGNTSQIRECVRVIKEETKRQTQLRQEIAGDQRLDHRLNAERQHRHP